MDRNQKLMAALLQNTVALRKESVDRNKPRSGPWPAIASLSARRAWIEIGIAETAKTSIGVALRKESVDRNLVVALLAVGCAGRSPQGERG